MNNDVIRIRIEMVIEMASAKSSSIAGSGMIRMARMAITPTASMMSPRRSISPRSLTLEPRLRPAAGGVVVTSVKMLAPCTRLRTEGCLGKFCRVYG